ncbi:MAG: zinc ribbon domain-containing protein [Bacteroidales bacterium]|nr:zinc ribbon domain-containing protein [Bacteroidales bacterium]
MKTYKYCQSCGMPLSKDPQKGGTNADGSINLKFCSYCFQQGEFTFKGSVKEFQEFCRQKMIDQGYSKLIAWLFTRGMNRLERWKKIE